MSNEQGYWFNKLTDWCREQQVENNLLELDVFPGPDWEKASTEEKAKAVYEMLTAPSKPLEGEL
jgi:hypothetical protein